MNLYIYKEYITITIKYNVKIFIYDLYQHFRYLGSENTFHVVRQIDKERESERKGERERERERERDKKREMVYIKYSLTSVRILRALASH